MKSWRTAAIAVVVSALAIGTVSADPRHGRGDGWRGDGGNVRDWGWNRPGGPAWPHHYNDPGTAFWGGVLGGVIGNIFRPDPPPVVVEQPPVIIQQPPVVVVPERTPEWCEAHYRSYNPETGTFTTYTGEQRPCP